MITDARSGASEEMSTRIRRYTITMAFRTACFISMIFVHGPFRWVMFGAAVLLPYIAVVLANQANQRTITPDRIERGEPTNAPQLTVGEPTEVISGDVVDGDDRSDDAPVRDRNVA